MEPFPGVVRVEAQDEDEVFNHLLELHRENGMFQVSEAKVRALIRMAARQEGGVLVGLIRGPEMIEASIGLVLDQVWYSDDWHLGERWIFVHPEHRNKNHAARLADFAKWCDAQFQLPLLLGIMSTSRTEAKERLYQRKFTRVGGFYAHRSDGPVVTGGEEVQPAGPVVHLDDLRKARASV
jgi:GNAT superfamily N-acetyltransferase